jgi:S1-C subfamily serine protease
MSEDSGSLKVSPSATRTELTYRGRPVVDSYPELRSRIEQEFGADTANLFAVPRQVENGIAWFDPAGASAALPLSTLPAAERGQVEASLRQMTSRLAGIYGEPGIGSLVFFALNVDSDDSIRVIGTRPILVGWGGLPTASLTPAGLPANHVRTIGPYLDSTDTPVLRPARVTGVASGTFLRGLRELPASLIAAAIALLVLIVLLLPGVLRLDGAFADPANAGMLRSLQDQIAAREQALRTDVCRPELAPTPRLAPPSGRQGGSIQENRPGSTDTAGAPDQARLPPYSVPVQPERSPVPNEVVPPGSPRPQNLAQLLAAVTVIVVTESGSGTGFFVSPHHILTNRHVIENSSGEVMVGNQALASIMPADRVAMSQSSDAGQPDYALLKLRNGQSQYFLSVAGEGPDQLQNVVAAGYPTVVMRSDANFQRLRNGDLSAIPEAAMTSGAVIVVQQRQTPNPVILHRASISAGNSGGPLVDECGRAIGVNTFVMPAGGANDRVNYALGIRSAVDFLTANNVRPNVVAGGCTAEAPRATPPAATPPTATPPAATPPAAAPPATSNDPSGGRK